MDRRAFLATGLGTVAATALAGCSVGGSSGTATEYDVGMTTADFTPAAITVSVGETVVWRNTSSHAHTVTAYEGSIPEAADFFASGGFESQSAAESGWTSGTQGSIAADGEYRHTFEVPGEYGYYCIPHEPSGMVGTVTVTESTATSE
jgi:plastocyanin